MGNPRAFLTIDRKEAGYRPVEERIHDYSEVEQTLGIEDRKLQASRCMDCGVPFCHWACPLGNCMPEYQDLVAKGRWREAYEVLNRTHPFPEFTGRVCPALCEKACVQALEHQAVTIRENEVATAERAFSEGYVQARVPAFRSGRRVAVVGSGPAGLAAADRLNQLGYAVTVFEKNETLGGLLRLGIPDFKLGKSVIDRRLALLRAEGIELRTGVCVGRDVTADDLRRDYDAVVLCAGAEVPRDLRVEGRDTPGVHFALELLQQQNRVLAGADIPAAQRVTAKGKHVLVIGGGDTGSDCVGTANRQGARSVTQIEVMPQPCEGDNPATPWPMYPQVLKTTSSHQEGCTRAWSLNTLRFLTDADGRLAGAEVEEVEWQPAPDGGRPTMVGTGRKKVIECQLVLLAMGFVHPDAALIDAFGLQKDARGNILTDASGRALPASPDDAAAPVFAAGDCRTGASLVVRAIASGRTAAAGVHRLLEAQR